MQATSTIGLIGTETAHDLRLYTDNTARVTVGAAGAVWVNATSAGSAGAQFEIKSKNVSTPGLAIYTSLGGLGFLVDAAGNLRANQAQTYATSVAAPTTVAGAVEFGSFDFQPTQGAGTLLIALNINGSGYAQTKLYLVSTTWAASTTWRQVVPISSSGPYEGNDCELDALQTTAFLALRVRRTAGSIAATAAFSAVVLSKSFAPFAVTGTSASVTPSTSRFLDDRTTGIPGDFVVGGKITAPGRDGPIASNADAATITLNLRISDLHTVTLGGNRTLAISNARTGMWFKVKLIQGGSGGYNPAWWSGITWYTADGNKPTPASGVGKGTYVQFLCTGTGTYDGFLVAPQP